MHPWMAPSEILAIAKEHLEKGDPRISYLEKLEYAYLSGALDRTTTQEAMRAIYFRALGSYARVED